MEIFLTQDNKQLSYNKNFILNIAPIVSPFQTLKEGKLQKVKTLFKNLIQAIYNVSKSLYLKTKQIDKYNYVTDLKLNLYCHHQMVKSFF